MNMGGEGLRFMLQTSPSALFEWGGGQMDKYGGRRIPKNNPKVPAGTGKRGTNDSRKLWRLVSIFALDPPRTGNGQSV